MILAESPEKLATYATMVQLAVYPTFKGMPAAKIPPYMDWWHEHFEFFKKYGRKTCAKKIKECLTEFIGKFPEVIRGPGSRASVQRRTSAGGGRVEEPSENEDECPP